jgi:hypothetical protein
MAAAVAASAAVRRTRSDRGRVNVIGVKEPVSFHLALILGNEYILPPGKNSADVLRTPLHRAVLEGPQESSDSPAFRLVHNNSKLIQGKSPNFTGTKLELWVKKFVSSQSDSDDFDKAWQDRLFIITEKRIFIVTKKTINNKLRAGELLRGNKFIDETGDIDRVDLEIVDSIPTDEIDSISLDNVHATQSTDIQPIPSSFITRSLRRVATKLNILPDDCDGMVHDNQRTSVRADRESADQCLNRFSQPSSENDFPSSSSARQNFCEPILRIATAPAGFNHGQTYHFILRKQDYPCVDSEEAVPLRNRAEAEALAARLAALAARRRAESARETRFLRLQRRLRRAWDSIPFNVALLVLIVSNFAFTVEQLQNTDPERQPFFERVDLAYTAIFALGPPSNPSIR